MWAESDSLVIISIFLLTTGAGDVRCQEIESPCPGIFSYRYDGRQNLYGEIRINGVRSNVLQLNVELSVGNRVGEVYNGHIELSKPKDQVLQDILNSKPIIYKVQLPTWTTNPPRITKILVNGELVCSGPRIPMHLVPVITTINLFHTLKVDILPLSSSNSPPENSIFYDEDSQLPSQDGGGAVRRMQFGGQFGRPPPPPPDEQFGRPSPPPRDGGQFGRPPPPPPDEGQYGRPSPPPRDGGQFGRPPPPPPDEGQFGRPSPPPRDGGQFGRPPPPPPDEGQYGRPSPPPRDGGQFGRPPPPPPDEGQYGRPSPPPRDGGQFGRPPPPPPDEGQFGRRPPPPPDGGQFGRPSPPPKKNRFQFNPVTPADPTKIYIGNPFLGTPSEEHYRPGGIFGQLDEMPYKYNPTDNPRPSDERREGAEEDEEDPPFLMSHRKDDDASSVHKGANFYPHQPASPYGAVCGRPVVTTTLISNGEAVLRGAYPWLGALYRSKPSGFLYVCSASLISDRHVVTAAHCVKNQNSQVLKPQELIIILGKLNLQRWGVHTDGEKMIEPESVVVHPDYKDYNADADVAILVLSEAVRFSKHVLPLCLWTEDSDLSEVVGKDGVVVGWGKDSNGVLMTDEPKQTKLPIVSQETCLRSSFEFLHVTSNRTFCAGFRNGNGPCNGDSGSGFIMNRNGKWTLRGIVSLSLRETGTQSCDLSNYVVFTDASKYSDWLVSFIKK